MPSNSAIPFITALVIILVVTFVFNEYTRRVMEYTALLAVKIYAVPGSLGLVLVGLLALDNSGGWITGRALALILLVLLCGAYLTLICITSLLGTLIALVMPKRPRVAAFLALTLVSLSSLFLFVKLLNEASIL